MAISETALLVIDAQESFRHRPYWSDSDVPLFMERLQALIAGAKSRKIPVVQIFHVEDSGVFHSPPATSCLLLGSPSRLTRSSTNAATVHSSAAASTFGSSNMVSAA